MKEPYVPRSPVLTFTVYGGALASLTGGIMAGIATYNSTRNVSDALGVAVATTVGGLCLTTLLANAAQQSREKGFPGRRNLGIGIDSNPAEGSGCAPVAQPAAPGRALTANAVAKVSPSPPAGKKPPRRHRKRRYRR